MSAESYRSVIVVGAGVVGEALGARLRDHAGDFTLRLTARSDESVRRLRAAGFTAERLDVVDIAQEALDTALAGAACVVFSAAAGRGGDYTAVYEGGAQKLAVACARSGAHLVYTSSTGVYAARCGEWVDEEAELDETNVRTRSLVAAERNVRGVDGTVLRLSGILARERGPHRRLDALAGTTRDDGEAWVNLAPLPTIVDALTAVIEARWRGVVNVSGAHPLRRREFYDELLLRAKMSPVTWTTPSADADLGRRVSVQRLRDALGIEPMDFDAGWLMS